MSVEGASKELDYYGKLYGWKLAQNIKFSQSFLRV